MMNEEMMRQHAIDAGRHDEPPDGPGRDDGRHRLRRRQGPARRPQSFQPVQESAAAAGRRHRGRLSAAQVREGNRRRRLEGDRHGQGLRAAPEGEPRRPGRRSPGEGSQGRPPPQPKAEESHHGCRQPVARDRRSATRSRATCASNCRRACSIRPRARTSTPACANGAGVYRVSFEAEGSTAVDPLRAAAVQPARCRAAVARPARHAAAGVATRRPRPQPARSTAAAAARRRSSSG